MASPLMYDQGEDLMSCLRGADLLPSPLLVLTGSTMGCDKAAMERILPHVHSMHAMPHAYIDALLCYICCAMREDTRTEAELLGTRREREGAAVSRQKQVDD